MAKGDVVSALMSVSGFAYLTIQPSAGVEYVIHNVYHENTITLQQYDGSVGVFFDTSAGQGAYSSFQFHATNSLYFRVLNSSSSFQTIGWDGIQTK